MTNMAQECVFSYTSCFQRAKNNHLKQTWGTASENASDKGSAL